MSGSVDPLVKAAAQFTVIDLFSYQPNLEDIFMAFYSGENELAAE